MASRSPRPRAGKGASRGAELLTGAVGHSGTRASNQLAREADVVLTIGTRLIDLTTGSNTLFQDPDVRFIGINVSGSDSSKLGALPVVADAKLALEDMTALLGSWQAPAPWRDAAVDAVRDGSQPSRRTWLPEPVRACPKARRFGS